MNKLKWKLNRIMPMEYACTPDGDFTIIRDGAGPREPFYRVDFAGKQLGFCSSREAAIALAESHYATRPKEEKSK